MNDTYERASDAAADLARQAEEKEKAASSSTGLFTHYCYANEVGRHTKPSKFWSDDGIQRTP